MRNPETLRREYIVCFAPGYPDPHMPWPNTREHAERFAAERYPAVVKTRLVSDWQVLAPGEPLPSFDSQPGQARRGDTSTAKAAAASLGKPGNKRRRVLQAIIDAGGRGLTSEEAVAVTGIEYRTLTPRVGELKRWGYIEALEGVTRLGTHGAQQQVLIATQRAITEMS